MLFKEEEIRNRFQVGQFYFCRSLYYFCHEKKIIPNELWHTRMSRYSHMNIVEQRRKDLEKLSHVTISLIVPEQMFLIVEHSNQSFCFEKSIRVLHNGGTGYIYPFNTFGPYANECGEISLNEIEIWPVTR